MDNREFVQLLMLAMTASMSLVTAVCALTMAVYR